MKKKPLMKSILLLLGIIISGCATSRSLPLDMETLESREFKLAKAGLMVTQEIDDKNNGKNFIIDEFPQILEIIKTNLEQDYNIVLDDSDFLSEIDSGTLEVEREVLTFKININNYEWNNAKENDQEMNFIVPFSINENNSIPLVITLYKNDPENTNKKFAKTINMDIQFSVNE